jgi:hypothetical protein
VVPMFTGTAKKVTAKSEVSTFFAEISAKEERYKNENGAYLTLTCTLTSITNQKQAIPCTTDANYLALGIIPPESEARCQYIVETGDKGDNPTTSFQPDSVAGASVPTTNPALGWYVLQAKCNMDNNTAAYSYYLSSSLDQTMQVLNEGK